MLRSALNMPASLTPMANGHGFKSHGTGSRMRGVGSFYLIVLLSSLLCFVSAELQHPTSINMKIPLGFYVAQQSQGILDVAFDPARPADEALTVVSTTPAGTMVGWLATHADNLYAISRANYSVTDANSGGVFSYNLPSRGVGLPHNGNGNGNGKPSPPALSFINSQSTHGNGGVYCSVSPDGSLLAAANIRGSVGAVYPLGEDGSIGPASSVIKFSWPDQFGNTSSPHGATFSPSGRHLFFPCRDADRVSIYRVGPGEDQDMVKHLQDIELPSRTGPRHVIFSRASGEETDMYMYLINEVDNTLRVFHISEPCDNRKPLKVTALQTLSTLGKGLPPTPDEHKDLAAELELSADGRFLYASNRNTESMDSDNLSVYSVDPHSHLLTFLGQSLTQGKIPRHFALSSDKHNRWIAVANQLNQDIIVFERDPHTGMPGAVRGRVNLGPSDISLSDGPMCILWK